MEIMKKRSQEQICYKLFINKNEAVAKCTQDSGLNLCPELYTPFINPEHLLTIVTCLTELEKMLPLKINLPLKADLAKSAKINNKIPRIQCCIE